MFFWSEDEARARRRESSPIDGIYLTMPQAGYVTRAGQASLFDIDLQTKKPRR
ncbi:MAG TPA: hypothetical protein VIE88_16340 [Vicinamibacteria bacterium]